MTYEATAATFPSQSPHTARHKKDSRLTAIVLTPYNFFTVEESERSQGPYKTFTFSTMVQR